jgi:hypothetical protein
LNYASAATRVRITTSDPFLLGPANDVIKAAAGFGPADADRWRRDHPYFHLLDSLHTNASRAEAEVRQLEDERQYDRNGMERPELEIAARDALDRYYAQQDSGEDPDPAPVRKAIVATYLFDTRKLRDELAREVADVLLPSSNRRHAFHKGLAAPATEEGRDSRSTGRGAPATRPRCRQVERDAALEAGAAAAPREEPGQGCRLSNAEASALAS